MAHKEQGKYDFFEAVSEMLTRVKMYDHMNSIHAVANKEKNTKTNNVPISKELKYLNRKNIIYEKSVSNNNDTVNTLRPSEHSKYYLFFN